MIKIFSKILSSIGLTGVKSMCLQDCKGLLTYDICFLINNVPLCKDSNKQHIYQTSSIILLVSETSQHVSAVLTGRCTSYKHNTLVYFV